MPGTTYTRTGPEQDPVGRLADFARFAHQELVEIQAVLESQRLALPYGASEPLQRALIEAGVLAHVLGGYTTADDAGMQSADGKTPDRFGRTWPKGYEVCGTCGQPDSCGDCNHERLSDKECLEIVSGVGNPTTYEAWAVLRKPVLRKPTA